MGETVCALTRVGFGSANRTVSLQFLEQAGVLGDVVHYACINERPG